MEIPLEMGSVTDGVVLEGVLGLPDHGVGPFPGVVMCHPHPLYGGDMHNNVVRAVYYGLMEKGVAALRFNFRGVGRSGGRHTAGEMEPQDALAALNELGNTDKVDPDRLGMAGYSFGSGVLLGNFGLYQNAKAFALVSPAVRHLENPDAASDTRPKIFISGSQDHAAPEEELRSLAGGLGSHVSCEIVPGVDHFWAGREREASRLAADFFLKNLTV